jgi:hypothetical protein
MKTGDHQRIYDVLQSNAGKKEEIVTSNCSL